MSFAVPTLAMRVIMRWEGLHRIGKDGLIYVYADPIGLPTIGYGRLLKSFDHAPITRMGAARYLAEDMGTAIEATYRLCPVMMSEPDERLAAIVSFAFNLGAGNLNASTLRKRVNERDWPGASREIQKWNLAAGRVLPGLVARRAQEAALLMGNRPTI